MNFQSPCNHHCPRIHRRGSDGEFSGRFLISRRDLNANALHLWGATSPETKNGRDTHLFPAIWGKVFKCLQAMGLGILIHIQIQNEPDMFQ